MRVHGEAWVTMRRRPLCQGRTCPAAVGPVYVSRATLVADLQPLTGTFTTATSSDSMRLTRYPGHNRGLLLRDAVTLKSYAAGTRTITRTRHRKSDPGIGASDLRHRASAARSIDHSHDVPAHRDRSAHRAGARRRLPNADVHAGRAGNALLHRQGQHRASL